MQYKTLPRWGGQGKKKKKKNAMQYKTLPRWGGQGKKKKKKNAMQYKTLPRWGGQGKKLDLKQIWTQSHVTSVFCEIQPFFDLWLLNHSFICSCDQIWQP